MNRFFKNEKSILTLFIVFALIFIIAIPAYAQTADVDLTSSELGTEHGEEGEGSSEQASSTSLLADPMFYLFLGLCAGFLALVAGSVYIYLRANNYIKKRSYEQRNQTTKIYDELDDLKWDAPDTVFIDAVEPPLEILTDIEPVKPIKGLESLTIVESPIEPVQAIRLGADPYAGVDDASNTVYENVPTVAITREELIAAWVTLIFLPAKHRFSMFLESIHR